MNDFLKDEYLALNKAVEDFDGKALTIKAWSVTASGAALSLAYIEHQQWLLLIAAMSSVIFWFIDALWKVNQRVYYPRIRQIEDHFSDSGTQTTPFQVSNARRNANIERPKLRRSLKVMLDPVVALPHVAVTVAGLVLLIAAPPAQENDKESAVTKIEISF